MEITSHKWNSKVENDNQMEQKKFWIFLQCQMNYNLFNEMNQNFVVVI